MSGHEGPWTPRLAVFSGTEQGRRLAPLVLRSSRLIESGERSSRLCLSPRVSCSHPSSQEPAFPVEEAVVTGSILLRSLTVLRKKRPERYKTWVGWTVIPVLVPVAVRPCPRHLRKGPGTWEVFRSSFPSFADSQGSLEALRNRRIQSKARTDAGFNRLLIPGPVSVARYTYLLLW